MQIFEESDLRFNFPDDWTVRKFDDTRAYQSLSGHGLKGVDFIAISPEPKLWLIEVKNYRPRRKHGKEYWARRKRPEVLAVQVATKFRDSLRLIDIVNRSLNRSWHIRLLIWYRTNVIPNTGSNYWFWSAVQHLAMDGRAVSYVLWMETPEENDDYDVRTYRELSALLPPEASLTVAEREGQHTLPFVVKPI